MFPGISQMVALALFATATSTRGRDVRSVVPRSERDTVGILSYVDPTIGTTNGGHVFAGATLPFGMAKAVADTDSSDNEGGFVSDDSNITGFSHMHDDGTGGSPSLGNFPLFAHPGCASDEYTLCDYSQTDRKTQRLAGSTVASPGYFSITLDTAVKAEMTTTNHAALYRFTFPSDPAGVTASPLILVDLTDLPNTRSSGNVEVDGTTGQLKGNASFSPSFGVGSYVAHFCAEFSGADVRNTGIFTNGVATNTSKRATGITESAAGAWTQFSTPESNGEIIARVGVSFISVAKACSNAEIEVPDFDFNGTRAAAEGLWAEKLGVVTLDATGVSDNIQKTFWSGLYRTMISPQDYTGENPLWQSTEPYYDSYYCLWDSFRSAHPLLSIVDPVTQSSMVRSLIDIYRFEGKLPDCRMSLCKGYTQGGSNADIVIVDAYVKKFTTGVDWATAYEAVVSDAEDEPVDWSVEGRGDLESWHNLGYIPINDNDTASGGGPRTRSISRTVEYAYDDFCISLLAQDLGNTADATKYHGRAGNWKNLFESGLPSSLPDGTNTGFEGFLQPKYLNGSWAYQDPTFCSPLNNIDSCYLNDNGHETYEGSSWLYTFFVPQDMAQLANMTGGVQTLASRLDYLHTSGLLYIGDEQAFLTCYQFHYMARPGLSARTIHSYIPSQFNDTLNGIPGNDDSGAMGSFAVLSMLGLWPVSGQSVYLITAPFFPSVSVKSNVTGKTATVLTVNFDAAYRNIYIQSATLNGQPWTKNWLDHDTFFNQGGTLELTLGSTESAWGTADADLPPSMSTSS